MNMKGSIDKTIEVIIPNFERAKYCLNYPNSCAPSMINFREKNSPKPAQQDLNRGCLKKS